ncbi:MAG: phosphotransferase family protein [Nonomuraea sp.]|nr:phosphotransferase family protein [Nonomuraea sp.]NUT44412.1 phosphotransferase family protein [Thermoactinospora sp.]
MAADAGQDALPPGLDSPGLRPWLAERLPDLDLSTARLVSGGRSNLTFEIGAGDPAVIVRRPPLGYVRGAAHDMGREHRVLSALAGSAVPVPRVIAYCADESVLDVPFLVMRKEPGVVHRTLEDLRDLTPQDARTIGHGLVDVLAAIHTVPWRRIGLDGFGRPDGYLARQVSRWRGQSAEIGEGVRAEELGRLLEERLPRSGPPALVHGDYRLDNVLIDHRPGPVVGSVLDWEMSTIGDPLADLGTFCMYWDGFSDLGLTVPSSPGALPGWPSRDELVARYAAAGGAVPEDLGWYVAFGYYRIAVILDGVHRRFVSGAVVGAGFDGIGAAVPHIIERGLDALARV